MSFIKDIEHKPQNQAMVQSIVDYANRTNTETCIEGIENQEVSDYIHQFGATWHQGFFYSKPVPIGQFETSLDASHRKISFLHMIHESTAETNSVIQNTCHTPAA